MPNDNKKQPHQRTNTPGISMISVDEVIDFWKTCQKINNVDEFSRLVKLAHKVIGPPKHERI